MTPLSPAIAAWYATLDDDERYRFDERCAIREAQPDIYTRMTTEQRRKAIERMTHKEMMTDEGCTTTEKDDGRSTRQGEGKTGIHAVPRRHDNGRDATGLPMVCI